MSFARAAGLVLLAALACGRGERSGGVTEVSGTLERAAPDRIAIRTPDGALTLRVDENTEVRVAGRGASAAELPEGAAVRASYRPGAGGEALAVSIEANDGAGRSTMRGTGSEMQRANEGPAGARDAPLPQGERGAEAAPPAPGAAPGTPPPSPGTATTSGARGAQGGSPAGSAGPDRERPRAPDTEPSAE